MFLNMLKEREGWRERERERDNPNSQNSTILHNTGSPKGPTQNSLSPTERKGSERRPVNGSTLCLSTGPAPETGTLDDPVCIRRDLGPTLKFDKSPLFREAPETLEPPTDGLLGPCFG